MQLTTHTSRTTIHITMTMITMITIIHPESADFTPMFMTDGDTMIPILPIYTGTTIIRHLGV